MMIVEKGSVFTDNKYGTDLVVKYVDDLVVMAKEKQSGHSSIYRREQFTSNNSRFIKND